MQSIISNNGFGFCKTSSFRNCNNCFYRIKCINYIPTYMNNIMKPMETRSLSLQNKEKIIEGSPVNNNTEILLQENAVLKERIQDLETQLLTINQSKDIKVNTNKVATQETTPSELQVYENKNLEVYQRTEAPLKTKKGIFGTKFVEDKPKNK